MDCYKLTNRATGKTRFIWSYYGDWEVYDYPDWTPDNCDVEKVATKK
ncbi:hypothetical protein LCGC14_1737930 [marine sediment metagenome]|uniref:Uncharacterized protein n=1 Tax=marine sediment metagenome TaxID=412755 RepID=A0A0F9H7H3_9ZZZZ